MSGKKGESALHFPYFSNLILTLILIPTSKALVRLLHEVEELICVKYGTREEKSVPYNPNTTLSILYFLAYEVKLFLHSLPSSNYLPLPYASLPRQGISIQK